MEIKPTDVLLRLISQVNKVTVAGKVSTIVASSKTSWKNYGGMIQPSVCHCVSASPQKRLIILTRVFFFFSSEVKVTL